MTFKSVPVHGEKDVRTWDALIKVDGYLPGSLVDWPGNIADPILAKVEALEKEIGLPLEVTFSQCEFDPDGFFLRVIVQHTPKFKLVREQ